MPALGRVANEKLGTALVRSLWRLVQAGVGERYDALIDEQKLAFLLSGFFVAAVSLVVALASASTHFAAAAASSTRHAEFMPPLEVRGRGGIGLQCEKVHGRIWRG